VDKFNNAFIGYSKNEVREFLEDLERKHEDYINMKKRELDELKDKVNDVENENRNLQKEIDNKKLVREDFFSKLDEEISKIDNLVSAKKKESNYKTDLAIEKLIKKRNDLVRIQSYLKELYEQLGYISENSSLVEKLHD